MGVVNALDHMRARDGGTAPRFHLYRTEEGALWRFRDDVPEPLAAEIAKLCGDEPRAPFEPPMRRAAFEAALAAHRPITHIWSGPAYVFPPDFASDAQAIAIDETNSDLLRGGLEQWLPDVGRRRPFLVTVEDGRAVCVCASVRIGDAAHEAGVETLPAYRKRGLALRAVSAWARAVKALGPTPYYSTAWDNIASQAIAARLGLACIGSDYSVT